MYVYIHAYIHTTLLRFFLIGISTYGPIFLLGFGSFTEQASCSFAFAIAVSIGTTTFVSDWFISFLLSFTHNIRAHPERQAQCPELSFSRIFIHSLVLLCVRHRRFHRCIWLLFSFVFSSDAFYLAHQSTIKPNLPGGEMCVYALYTVLFTSPRAPSRSPSPFP